ncbi:hypothetical protein [Flavobacterium psychraquaticum]|uniref:hypothetical protein n=1 Tax=Flavobacterium psychraquaticum TaxID=3103958 RepID=UPI002ACD205C|nr:hypothetical protein [Flavobacterium sp. LB-N7T]
MDRFNLIINHLEKIKSNTASKEDYKFIEDIIKIEAANYNTFSKLVYDIFLFFIKDVKDSNYTFEAYKSWYIKTKELEMFWDGRDSYLLLWDISSGERKTLKIENSDIITFVVIKEYLEIISKN